MLNYESGTRERVTGGKRVITTDHGSIHSGDGFHIITNFSAVANGSTVNVAFKTPSVDSGKYIHFKYNEFWTSGTKVSTTFYEAPTNAPTGGSAMTPINRNRNSAKISDMQSVANGMTINTTGAATISSMLFGGTSAYRPLDIEMVLKPNTWYIRTFTNNSGSAADINAFQFWYEEDGTY